MKLSTVVTTTIIALATVLGSANESRANLGVDIKMNQLQAIKAVAGTNNFIKKHGASNSTVNLHLSNMKSLNILIDHCDAGKMNADQVFLQKCIDLQFKVYKTNLRVIDAIKVENNF